MYDLVVRNGLVVDGSGLAGKLADVGVQEGRITAIGKLAGERSRRTVDATGLVVAPGIVDPHTHYDPQSTWDPMCDTSGLHGVTTVVSGNTGFSIAPCRPDDHDYLIQMFARVEGMSEDALGHVDWRFETFPEFLGALEGRLGLNMGVYVGHSALRRYVLGDAALERASTEDEKRQIVALTEEALRAGAMGWSSSKAPTHLDLANRPVPSRMSDGDELLAMADALGAVGGRGSIAYAPESAMEGIDTTDRALMIEWARRAGAPVVIQGLGWRNMIDTPELAWQEASELMDRSAALGSPVYCLLMVRKMTGPFDLIRGSNRFVGVPLWMELFSLDFDQRLQRLTDPELRAAYRHAVDNPNRDAAKGSTNPPPHWDYVWVHEAFSEDNQRYVGRTMSEIARAEGRHPADVLFDIAVADDLKTVFFYSDELPGWHDVISRAQKHPQMVVGISDGGAHVTRDDGAAWSTFFLKRWWQEEKLWRLEEAIRLMTIVPARMCGIADRGLLSPGWRADMMLFDPDHLSVERVFESDSITGVPRFRNVPTGFHATIVNGVPVISHGEATGELPGHVIRPT